MPKVEACCRRFSSSISVTDSTQAITDTVKTAPAFSTHLTTGTDAPAITGISFSSICICTKPLACSVALIRMPLGRDSACSA